MSAAKGPAPFEVGSDSLIVVGVEGRVDHVDTGTVTINGITLPRVFDKDRGVVYLSTIWPATGDGNLRFKAEQWREEARQHEQDLRRLGDLVRREHDDHHDGPFRFCSHALCRDGQVR